MCQKLAQHFPKALLCVAAILISALSLVPSQTAHAVNPNLMSFQGKVVNADGTNVADGTYNFDFIFYSDPTLGSPSDGVYDKWHELTKPVVVTAGVFQTNLGSATTLPDFNANPALYLSFRFNADAAGYMLPRLQLTSVPYAINSDKLGGLDKTGYIQNNTSLQTTSNFHISGDGKADTSFTTPTLQSAAATALTITGNAASTWSTSAGNITLQAGSGTISLGSTTTLSSSGALNISAGTTLSLTSTGTNAVSLDSGTTGAINIGTNANAKTISIGTGATIANTINIGGTGANTIGIGNTQTAGSISLGAALTTGTISIGGTGLQTGTINLGTGTGAQAINLGTGGTGAKTVVLGSTAPSSATAIQAGTGGLTLGDDAVANTIQVGNTTGAVAQTVNVGNNATVSSTSTVVAGSNKGSSTTTLQAGSGGIIVGNNGATNTAITINGTALVKTGTDSATAFQIQNAAGNSLLLGNTTNQSLTVTNTDFYITNFGTPAQPTVAAGSNQGGTLSGASGTTYYYRITGLNAAGESVASVERAFAATSFTALTAPAAPSAAVGVAGNVTGTYTYRVTLVTANGETTQGTVSASVAPAAQQVDLTAIPTGATGTTGRNIYRCDGAGANCLRLSAGTTIADNTTTIFTDNTASYTGNPAPPGANTARTNLNNATVTFTTIVGATSYRIYRSTTTNSATAAYQTTAASPFTDTGAAGTTVTVPTSSTIGRLGIGTVAPNDALEVVGAVRVSVLGAADTATALCRNSSNQLATCNTTGVGTAFVQGGNTFGATATLGTNDAQSLVLETASVARLTIDNAGAATFSGTLAVTGGITGSSTITGTTLNATTGINTGGGAGTLRLNAAGALSNITGYTQSSGNATFNQNAADQFRVIAAQAPTTDQVNISNAGFPITTDAVNGQQIDYYANLSSAAFQASGLRVNATNTSAVAGSVTNGFRVVASGAVAGTTNGIKVDNFTSGAGGASALYLGTGWKDLLSYNGTQLISGTGILQNVAVSGSYTGITGTGALAAGSIASGFGTIATANTITGTTINGTTGINTGGAGGTQRLDSAGALSNITGYSQSSGSFSQIGAGTFSTGSGAVSLNGATSVTGANTFTSGTGTVLLQGNTDVAASASLATKAGATFTTPGTSNNAALNVASLYLLDTSGAQQVINGITAGRDGQHLTLTNVDVSLVVTLTNNSGLATGSKIITGTGSNVDIPVGSSLSLVYDSVGVVWRVIGGAANGNGNCISCANTALSNLGSVAINTALLTAGDNTIDLGSVANSFRTLYADTSVLSPAVDTASVATLSLGTTTANAVSISKAAVATTINGSLVVAQGSTFNGAVGISSANTLTVGTGATVLGGTLAVTGISNFTGNVGIGTAPGKALDVVGEIRAQAGSYPKFHLSSTGNGVDLKKFQTYVDPSGNYRVAALNDAESLEGSVLQFTRAGALSAPSTITGTQLISTVATGTAPLTVTSTTRVNNLNAELFDGVSSFGLAERTRAQSNLSGGGTVSWTGGNFKWTTRFIAIANGNGSHFSTSGYFDIDMPTSGTITGVGGAPNVTATASGIPLAAWTALYYILPIGSNNPSVAANLRVATYTSALQVPSDWILVALNNTDNGTVRTGSGQTIRNGGSYTAGVDDGYIVNGTALQTANFNINGNGTIGGSLTVSGQSNLNGFVKANLNGLIGSANNNFYDLGAGRIAAGTSIYSYGSICTGNPNGDCSGVGGVVLNGSTITSGQINGQTISGAANFTGTLGVASTLTAGGQLNFTQNSQAIPASAGAGALTWNFTGGQGEPVIWNLYDAGAQATDFRFKTGASTQARGLRVLANGGNGKIEFGDSLDTNLYRSAADTLKTDDSLVVAGSGNGSTTYGALFKNGTNSTTAFQIQNAGNGSLFNVDSSYSRISINSLNSGELNGTSGTWNTNANALPAARDFLSSVVANGYVYVIGGSFTSTVYYAKLNSDGSAGTWNTNANALPAARDQHTSVVANGYVYVIGGNSVSTVYYAKLNSDGSTGTWTTNANALPAARQYHSSVVANGYVYVIGGAGPVSTVYYAKLNSDGSTGTWTTNANALPAATGTHSSVVANGYVYVIGGYSGGAGTANVLYAKLNSDGSTGTWTTITNALPAARQYHSSVVANGYVYVIGGHDAANAVQSTIYYAKLNSDGSAGTWNSNANALPATRDSGGAVVANGYVYYLGGHGGGGGGAQSTVYYASTSRISLGGALDLVGAGGQNLSDPGSTGGAGSTGGELTAGNTNVIGDLQVQGQGTFVQGVSVDKDLRVGGNINVNASLILNTGVINSAVPDGASAVAFTWNTKVSYATSGGKLLSLQNNGTEKFAVDKDGSVKQNVSVLDQSSATAQDTTAGAGTTEIYNVISITLTPGTWIVDGNANGASSATDYLQLSLYNSTDSVDVTNSQGSLNTYVVGTGYPPPLTAKALITVTANKVIKLKISPNGNTDPSFGTGGAGLGNLNRLFAQRISL